MCVEMISLFFFLFLFFPLVESEGIVGAVNDGFLIMMLNVYIFGGLCVCVGPFWHCVAAPAILNAGRFCLHTFTVIFAL